MKKLLTLLAASAISLTTAHASYTNGYEYPQPTIPCPEGSYYEEYSGYQNVWQGEDYDFEFALRQPNVFPISTSSDLTLTVDEVDGKGQYKSGKVYIKFFSKDWVKERATITATAYGNGTPYQIQLQHWFNGNYNNGYVNYFSAVLPQAFLAELDDTGLGNVNIAAEAMRKCFENDFAIKKVAMCVEPVPEPSSIALMMLGLSGLAAYRKKRRQS